MLIKHSAVYLLGRIIPGAVSLLALALYTRLLTADQYGHYALLIAAVSFVNAVCFQWLKLSLGRFLPAHENQPQALLSTALAGYLGLVALTGVLGIAIAWFWPDKTLRWFIVLAVVLGWAQAWFDLNQIILNVRLTPVRYGLNASTKAILGLALGVAFFYFGLGVAGILLGLLLGLLIPTVLVLKQWHHSSPRHYSGRLLKDLVGYGAPLTLTFMLILVLDVSDRFLLGWLVNAEAVGKYAAAYDLTQYSLGMLMSVVHLAAFPLALHALERDGIEAARKQISDNVLLLLVISVPATVGLALLADNIAVVMLGAEFREQAAPVIALVGLAIFVGGIKSYYFDYSFQLGRAVKGQAWTVVWGAMANVVLNFWWIPQYGVIGAACATLGGFAVALIASWYLGQRVFTLPPPPPDSYKIVLASAVMAASLWPTIGWRGPSNLVAQILIGCSVYATLLISLNVGQSRHKLMEHFGSAGQKKPQPSKLAG